MYDLTQLEQAGFEFTPLERLVFENPSFRILYEQWPVKWGSLTTGLAAKFGHDHLNSYTVVGFSPTEQERLTPNAAANLFDEFSRHARSVAILAAKVARDASACDADRRLVEDLSLWFDGITSYAVRPFRWVRFEEEHQGKLKREARSAEVAALSQGTADVVILLLDMLAQGRRRAIRDAVAADCLKREIFSADNKQVMSHYYHLPLSQCMLCNGPDGRFGGGHCDSPSSIVLVDCGDVPTIMRGIPADVRRIVKPVRFKVPKSTFSDRFEICVGTGFFPQFAIFSTNDLSANEQRSLRSELETGLHKKQKRWIKEGYYSNCQIIGPAGRQKMNVLLLAGTIADSRSWAGLLSESDFWSKLRYEKRVSVDLVG